MNFARIAIIILLTAATISPALAERQARPGPTDARIRTVNYAARDVVRVNGHYGFTTAIEFAAYETIETISIGDSEAWQVVKPPQPNIFFIKPLEQNADTNLTVITDLRIYNFILYARQATSHDSPGLTFLVRFTYPEDEAQLVAFQQTEEDRIAATVASISTVPPEAWNFDYAYDGSETLRPSRVFDDGRFTYFAFPETTELPSIFLVDENRNESLINHQTRGNYVVVERLGRQFTLRVGDAATCIFNNAFPSDGFDAASPTKVARVNRGIRGWFQRSSPTVVASAVPAIEETDDGEEQ